jgi:hypothetical protein
MLLQKMAPHVLYCDKNDVAANNLHDGKFKYKESCHEFSPIMLPVRWLKKHHA